MGALPWWYASIRASKYLGSVKPWEWDTAPLFWREAALAAEAAEGKASEILQERAQRKSKSGGRGRR